MGRIKPVLRRRRHSERVSTEISMLSGLLTSLQSVSAMSSFFLAMTAYPEVQRKCQAEIDAVVGNDRLPTLADRDQLPYLTAMLKEVIRWGPTAPLGVPHCIERDDVHDGYFIPKGSIIMANIWCVFYFTVQRLQVTHDCMQALHARS